MTNNNFQNDTRIFHFRQVNYIKWLKEFAATVGSEVKDNYIKFLPEVGSGYSKSFFLENGLTACINNYTLKDEYIFNRQPTEKFGVIIYLYHFKTQQENIEYKVDNVLVNVLDGDHYALRMTNAQTPHELKFGKNTWVQGLSIFLESEWIEKNAAGQVLEVFNYLKQVNYFKQFLNAKQKRLLNELLEVAGGHPYPDLYVRSRIYRILDKLLENFLNRDISESPEKISEEDFVMLQRIEAILTQSYNEAFPGIEKLSRTSLMSESKLKKLFKQAFGMGLYEYFQKNRMHRAKEQILSGKYSISEVGIKLGYQNLSNFSAAFRKEFQCLPSELEIL